MDQKQEEIPESKVRENLEVNAFSGLVSFFLLSKSHAVIFHCTD